MERETNADISEQIDDTNMDTKLGTNISDGEDIEMVHHNSNEIVCEDVPAVIVEREECDMDLIGLHTDQQEGQSLGEVPPSWGKEPSVVRVTDTCTLNINGEDIVVETNANWDEGRDQSTDPRVGEKDGETEIVIVSKNSESRIDHLDGLSKSADDIQLEIISNSKNQQINADTPVTTCIDTLESVTSHMPVNSDTSLPVISDMPVNSDTPDPVNSEVLVPVNSDTPPVISDIPVPVNTDIPVISDTPVPVHLVPSSEDSVPNSSSTDNNQTDKTAISSVKTPIDTASSSGKTPTVTASSSGKTPTVTVSRSGKTPIDTASSSGKTPINTASSSGKPPIDTASSSGKTPIDTSASSGITPTGTPNQTASSTKDMVNLPLQSISPFFQDDSKSSLANVSLDSLVNMIKTTVDDWRKDNPLQPLSNETQSLRQDAQLLCDKFAACGEEAIFVVVNKSDSATSYQGTKTGMSFLDERSDVLDDFVNYCKASNKRKRSKRKENSKKSKSKGKVRSAVSDRTEEEDRGNDDDDDCDVEVDVDVINDDSKATTPLKKRALEHNSPKQNEEKAKRQKVLRNTTPNDSDMEGYEEKSREEIKSEEYLPRSSRKVKLPSWRKDYGTLLIDYSMGSGDGQQSGSSNHRSSIPKFTLEGKYVKLEAGSTVRGEVSRYTCLQCRAKVVVSNLRRHWEKHESEDGHYICKGCNKTFKTLRYLQIHDLLDHEGLTELTFCNKCDKRFPTEGLLIQHFLKIHKKKYPASSKRTQHQDDKSTKPMESSRKPSKDQSSVDEAACDICGKRFSSAANLRRHKTLAHFTEAKNEKPRSPKADPASDNKKKEKTEDDCTDREEEWSCHLCKNVYKLYSNLQHHLSQKHHVRKDYDEEEEEREVFITCLSCDQTFDSYRAFSEHNDKEHHGKGQKSVKSLMWIKKQKTCHCSECNLTFGKPEFLLKHGKVAHFHVNSSGKEESPVTPSIPSKDGLPYCEKCDRTFARKLNYLQHMRHVHNTCKTSSTPKPKSKPSVKVKTENMEDTDSLAMVDDEQNDPDFTVNDHENDPDSNPEAENFHDTVDNKSKKKRSSNQQKYYSEEDFKACSVKLKDFGDRVDLEKMRCKICYRMFKSPVRLFQHMENHDSPAHECSVCGKKCATPFRLKEHMRKHSQGLPCKFCNGTYMHQRNLNRHYVKVHKMKHCKQCKEIFPLSKMAEHFASCRPKEGMIRCRICWQIFKDKNTHQAHMERHRQRSEKTNIKRAIIICKICKSKFESKEMLINHVITSHPDRMESYPMQTGRSSDGILKCKSCYKEFYSKESFALHQASHIEKVHKCEICRARFSSTYSLKLHSKIHLKPGQAVLHECKVCHKTFLRPNSLSIHMFAHRSTKDFSCSECGKSFRLKASLRSHLRVHNKFFFYICKCGEKFRSKSTFRNHIVAYHREDKEVTNFPIYKCEYCQKEFVSKHRYMEHTSFHTGRKTFSCSLCSSKFATQGKLNWHVNRVHMTKKKFICKVCDLSSENETKFKKHLQTITHIEECKAANIELKQFYDDLEALEKGCELSEPRVTFDVIYESSENGKERKEINVKRKDCSICKKKFITVKALHNHRKDRHTHCSVCNENFKSPMSFQKHIGRKSHMETCKNKGIDPEAFLFCFKSDGILEEGEQPEEDTDFESLTAIGGIDGSKISNDVTQLMDHQYQTHEGITQSTTELSQNLQGTSQNNTSLRSILPSNQPKAQGTSATNLKVQSPNVKVITVGNQLASPRSLLKTSHNKNVTTINIQGTSGNVQVQKTPQSLTGNPGKQQVVSQSLLGASQTPIVASQSLQRSSHSQQLTSQTQSQQLTSHSLLGASQIPGTGQGEGPLIIAEGLQEVENYVIEDSAVIAEAQQAVEVLGSMNDDNMEYVLITIPNDSLTVREDGTYLLNDTVLGDVLK